MTKKTILVILLAFVGLASFGQEYLSASENEIDIYATDPIQYTVKDTVVVASEIPPRPIITSDKLITCSGERATLVALGCYGTITWNTGATGSVIQVVGGTFSATCTNQYGTSAPSEETIIRQGMSPRKPTISLASPIVCEDREKKLIASGCNGQIRWSTGATQTSITVSASGSYTAVCMTLCGNSALADLLVVQFLFPPYVLADNTGPYQSGDQIELNSRAASVNSGYIEKLIWRGPNDFMATIDTVKIMNAGIAESGTYSLTATDNYGCSRTVTTNVVVEPCIDKIRVNYVKTEHDLQYLVELKDGAILNKLDAQTGILVNPVCQLDTSKVRSVEIVMTGPEPFYNRAHIENVYPYSVFGNDGLHISGAVFPIGEYTLTITAYTQKMAQGDTLFGPKTIHFSVVDFSSTISLLTVNITEVCAGSTTNIAFASTGSFPEGNVFEIQLSDENGSFENPISIGKSIGDGNIQCSIPANMPQGNGYKIRVHATMPSMVSNISAQSFTINARVIELKKTNDNIDSIVNKKAGEVIKADNEILPNAYASYKSGRYILLSQGFEVQNGAVFETKIESCF